MIRSHLHPTKNFFFFSTDMCKSWSYFSSRKSVIFGFCLVSLLNFFLSGRWLPLLLPLHFLSGDGEGCPTDVLLAESCRETALTGFTCSFLLVVNSSLQFNRHHIRRTYLPADEAEIMAGTFSLLPSRAVTKPLLAGRPFVVVICVDWGYN